MSAPCLLWSGKDGMELELNGRAYLSRTTQSLVQEMGALRESSTTMAMLVDERVTCTFDYAKGQPFAGERMN